MNAINATVIRGPQQHMRALERANKVRLARAELKRLVAHGEIDAATVILECPWEAESMPVAELLTSQRRWGHTRCRKFLAGIPLGERKTIGSMTERQRRALAIELGASPDDLPEPAPPLRPMVSSAARPVYATAAA
jgi:hypothetical protein